VPDPERQDTTTLADDLAAVYVAVKEGLLSIPERAGRVPAFVIWNWMFALETKRWEARHQGNRRAAFSQFLALGS
jgi:hypothetical protein